MSAGGLTGAGGGSITGSTPPPLQKQSDSAALISYAQAGSPKPDVPKREGSGGRPDAEAKTGHDSDGWTQTEEQSQKLQDFDAVQGRPGLSDEQHDGQEEGERQPVLLAGTTATAVAGGASSGAATGVLKTGADVAARVLTSGAGAAAAGAAAAVILTPTNSSHAETLSIPGHPQYRITGNQSEVGRTLEVANADGSWSKVGNVSVTGDQNGTTVDMAEVNSVLKDRGFEPIGPQDMSLPGAPIDGPKGPAILSTPDQAARTADVTATPNHGPRGADVTSTPVPEEQGPQISEARDDKLDGKLKQLGLPTEGNVTFDPSKKATEKTLVTDRGEKHGYLDNDKNEWNWDKKKSEWDVTLSEKGKRKLGHLSNSGTHVNVAADGKITH